jgi:hypothetical protein
VLVYPSERFVTRLSERVVATLVRDPTAVAVFALLAVPGFTGIQFLSPSNVEFYLIAFVASAGHLTLKRMDRRDRPVATEFASIGRGEAVVCVSVLLAVAVATTTLRLGLGVIVGGLVVTSVGESLLVVLGPAVTPFVDYLLGERHWWLSPSGIVVVSLSCVVAVALRRVNQNAAESIRTDARRVDPM